MGRWKRVGLLAGLALLLGIGTWTWLYVRQHSSNRPVFVRINDDVESTLWLRGAAVYEGQVGDRWIMTLDAMNAAAESFVGKPVLVGHDWVNSYMCVGIIRAAAVRLDHKTNLHYIEIICEITDQDAIQRITSERFARFSIGFNIIRQLCSIDGLDMSLCPHDNGKRYLINGEVKLALGIIVEFTGYEVSFVNVPASRLARVLEWSSEPLHLSVSN